jgi:hypothetical protein
MTAPNRRCNGEEPWYRVLLTSEDTARRSVKEGHLPRLLRTDRTLMSGRAVEVDVEQAALAPSRFGMGCAPGPVRDGGCRVGRLRVRKGARTVSATVQPVVEQLRRPAVFPADQLGVVK